MNYSVLVLPTAEKELLRLPSVDARRIMTRLNSLGGEPRPVGVRKLQGSSDRYRIRQGRFRILYRVDDRAKRVIVYAIGDRKDVYR